jgi:Uma2 family endonuclease
MRETGFHSFARLRLIDTLDDHFADVPNVYVSTRLAMFYKEGDRIRHRDPDALVAKGVGKHLRRSFRIWQEKVIPCVLFEIASAGTWRIDLYEKPALYAALGVKECFLYDAEGCYLDPLLQGFRTVKGKPVPLKPAADGTLLSKQLGLRLVPEGPMLRLMDLRRGKPIPTRLERIEYAEQARLQAEQERRCAGAGAQRIQDLQAEVRRLRNLLAQREAAPLSRPVRGASC